MYDSAESHAEHAGMAVHTAHGGQRWISSWVQRKVSARTEGAAIAAATVLAV